MPSRNTRTRRLDDHLILHAWLNSHFGYKNTRELLKDMESRAEGFNPDGHSPLCMALLSRANLNPDIAAKLPTYDLNIKRHLSAINVTRTQPIVLRYFQYLALLYTEIFLDYKFNRPAEFLQQLNNFVESRNAAKAPGDPPDSAFTETDIEKLAFWMATGAGKTLIMHVNYHQYLHYCQEALDHIVLITPNEGLSEQHLRELGNSGIPCERFNVEGNRGAKVQDTLQVIEITKLVETRTGGGLSVPVEAFEGQNLIFVDEGHKGSGGKVWRDRREELAETGFTFEYSATFGQALAAASNADLVEEYGKAIAFDYSYRYFYGDGYGKDFRILNVQAPQTEMLLSANLLSFYQQRHYFRQNAAVARDYGLDSPLWAFVGSKVNAVYTEKRESRSDVLNVLHFLHRFLINENNWVFDTIERILDYDSGLSDDDGVDVFASRFQYLNSLNQTPADIYAGILKEVFHTDTNGALHLQDVQNASGEIALKSTHGAETFGLIYIGDTAAFKKLVENDDAGMELDSEDAITEGLFSDINTPDSPINILIGAKKFIEGWDSWRVTTMGLLNIGRQEGSQIIQLFGRGVRLRGKDMSLKRSSAVLGEHPEYIRLLETLNIFAVRANFMTQFQEYLTREGVPHEEPRQIELPIQTNRNYLANRLYVPEVKPYHEGAAGTCVPLEVRQGVRITHTTQSVSIIGSSPLLGIQTNSAEATLETRIPKPSLALLDWEKIYLQLLEYKQEKQYHNLIFNMETLKEIMNPDRGAYTLSVMAESEVKPQSLAELERLETLVLTLLQKYITKFYKIIQKQWSSKRVRLRRLDESDPNFTDWNLRVSREEAEEIQNIIESEASYGGIFQPLRVIRNNRHLYQPLLTAGDTDTTVHATPPLLENSETRFVGDLQKYIQDHSESLLSKKEVFLLRNQSRGKGVGFYRNAGFYPDFILWILDGSSQRIVFIEPHGMVHEDISEANEKINLFRWLRELSQGRFRDKGVQMDSFIISETSFSDLVAIDRNKDLNKSKFDAFHILFPHDTDLTYLEPIFTDE